MIKWNDVCYEDCMNDINGLPSLQDKIFDACFTDPPYGIGYDSNYYKNGNPNPKIKNDDIYFIEWIKEIYRVLKDNSFFLMFSRFDVYPIFLEEIKKYFNYKNLIIWVKNNWSAGDLKGNFGFQYEVIVYATKGRYEFKGKRHSNVFHVDRVKPNVYNHQTPKPVKLICDILKSLKPTTLIDPFLGSGAIAEACELMKIKWFGYEIEKEKYTSDIEKRLKKIRTINTNRFI